MTLVYPANGNDPGHKKPRIHILAIGVDDYPCMQSTAAAAPHLFNPARLGLAPLSSPVVSAKAFVDWFIGTYTILARVKPSVELGTVELLLSHGTHGGNAVDKAELPNIKTAFNSWAARCDRSPDNVAVFYFCGHGIATDDDRTLLLPADFGANPNNLWNDAIDWGTTRVGMYDCQAQTQWYFLDCCRETPVLATYNKYANRSMGQPLKSRVTNRPAPEISQAFKACGDGQTAHGPRNAKSYFTAALLECMERFGVSHHDGYAWVVVTDSLADSLCRRMQRITMPNRKPGICDIKDYIGASVREIYGLPAAEVMAEIDCDPTDGNEYVRLTLTDLAGGKPPDRHGPKAGAMTRDLLADQCYDIDGNIVYPCSYKSCSPLKAQMVYPPLFSKKVRVQ